MFRNKREFYQSQKSLLVRIILLVSENRFNKLKTYSNVYPGSVTWTDKIATLILLVFFCPRKWVKKYRSAWSSRQKSEKTNHFPIFLKTIVLRHFENAKWFVISISIMISKITWKWLKNGMTDDLKTFKQSKEVRLMILGEFSQRLECLIIASLKVNLFGRNLSVISITIYQ